jgi:hypothetical protein
VNPATEILKTGQWKGRRCVVVGSGPSSKPFDRGLLANELTIGVNEEWRWQPTISVHSDVRMLKGDGQKRGLRDEEAYLKSPSIKLYHKGHPHREAIEAPAQVYEIGSRNTRAGRFWGYTVADGLVYEGNCGLAALNLADILRASPIFLVGFDACAGRGLATHSHDFYPLDWRMRQDSHVYRRWISVFTQYAKDIKGEVINVVGVPESKIECFRKIDYVEFMSQLRVEA